MADKNLTTDLSAAASITGSELMYVVKGGNSRKTAVSNVAALVTQASLSLEPGTDVQAQDVLLQDIADLSDPGGDRGLFWDDGAGAIAWHTYGAGLVMDGTSLRPNAAIATLTGTGSATLTIGHAFGVVNCDAGTTGTQTIIIPNTSAVDFPVGAFVELHMTNTGTVSVGAGGGVTLQSRGSLTDLAGQYAVAGIRHVAANTWRLTGDIA